MKQLQTFKVYPSIPQSLVFLEYLSKNLWWCWNYDAVELFRRINPRKWDDKKRNPVAFLASVSQRRLRSLTEDDSFIGHLERVKKRFEAMFSFSSEIKNLIIRPGQTIAYLSMEYGIHESLPMFAGGLGVLAGDHLKASSCLGIPLTGIGLLFNGGYFRQYLDHDGWQQESYPEIDIFHLPIQRAKDTHGEEIAIDVPSPNGTIKAIVWQIKVGRIRLLLLDTNISENPPAIRDITHRLYASHSTTRIAQEALLGVGGMRALEAMGLFPAVHHMNEGHCAFAGLERLSRIIRHYNVDLNTALDICKRSGIFTTHTPVEAGHDEFDPQLVIPYLEPYADLFDISEEEILSWGQLSVEEGKDYFYTSVLGMKLSGFINGVSLLHGKTARGMWNRIWPQCPVDEVPISHVTNGVHILSYISQQKASLFERYLGTDWGNRSCNSDLIERIDNIEDEDLWHIHGIDRSRLIRRCRKILLKQYSLRNAPRIVIDSVSTALDHHVLTICFARRFATYKRADLLLKYADRLEAIINSETMPVQFVFAGKAHPNDTQGKEIIQRIFRFANKDSVRHRVVFLEDYDIDIARYMVQGADVWLNTPRRPMEACGTSGMKAAVNGGLNLSVLDGWWCEGFNDTRGWSIGANEDFGDDGYQDTVESHALYNLLENDVIPKFYDRKRGNPPTAWTGMMKESMKMALLNFSSHRMVKEYSKRFYIPASLNMKLLTDNDSYIAKQLAEKKQRLKALWEDIIIERPSMVVKDHYLVGDSFELTTTVFLGSLTSDDVEVQIYYGKLKSFEELEGGRTLNMTLIKKNDDGSCLYSCTINCSDAGRFGYSARVIPRGDDVLKNTPGLLTWAD